MRIDVHADDLTVAIVGGGTMGRGIAQVLAQAGVRVLLHDAEADAAKAARTFVETMLRRAAERGRIGGDAADAALARIEIVGELAALAPASVVIEAIVERLDAKRALFARLEEVIGDGAVLATNTSSLSVTAIAAGCRRPERVAGLHFFNPVPLMKVVEVIRGERTDAAVCDALVALAERFGHRPVRTVDSPGFLINHAGRGLYTEGLRIVQEGVADPVTVDRIMREAAGFRMGPFELLDLTGLDVSYPVMELIYNQFYQEPRFRPSPLPARRVAAGLLGRKSGEGFYRYDGGSKVDPGEPPTPDAENRPIWIDPARANAAELVQLLHAAGTRVDEAERPGGDSVCLTTPLGHDATSTALDEGLDPRRTLAVDMLFGLERRVTLMRTPVTDPAATAAAHAALARSGRAVSVIHDSPGFVAPRVVATIVNIACDIAQQRIATPEDINAAVKLGLGYPQGPLDLGDRLGATTVLAILEALHGLTLDPRYRPSPWLRRRALLGVPLTTPEA